MATIKYADLCETTVASGGYTSGGTALNVASTGSPWPSGGNFYIYVADATTKAVKAIFKVTAKNSSTQWATTAIQDANCAQNDIVRLSITAGMLDDMRGDMSRTVTGALPSDGRKGDQLAPSDDVVGWLHDGSNFNPFGPSFSFTNPLTPTFTWRNQGTSTRTDRAGSIYVAAQVGTSNNMRCLERNAPSTPYTIEIGFQPHGYAVNFATWGLYFLYSGNGKAVTFGLSSSSNLPSLQVNYMTSVTSYSSTPISGINIMQIGAPLLFQRIKDDGTNLTFYWSVNGLDWIQFGGTLGRTAHTGTAPDKVGFHLDPNNASSRETNATIFHYKEF